MFQQTRRYLFDICCVICMIGGLYFKVSYLYNIFAFMSWVILVMSSLLLISGKSAQEEYVKNGTKKILRLGEPSKLIMSIIWICLIFGPVAGGHILYGLAWGLAWIFDQQCSDQIKESVRRHREVHTEENILDGWNTED